MRQRLVWSALLVTFAACGGKDSPVTPTPTPTPTPATATVSGSVSLTGGARVPGATVRIYDGPNAGRSVTTNASGDYVIDNLKPGNANVTANATIYDEVVLGAYLIGAVTMNFVFPIPACQTNNTGSVSFGNRSAGTAHDIIWDGARYASGLAPGQNTPPLTATAGIAHTVSFRVVNTQTLACSSATPVLTQCERGRVITCSGP